MAQKITIVVDADGNAEIRSPLDLTDDEVLDILSQAVSATAEKIEQEELAYAEDQLERPLEVFTKKKVDYRN